jgi:glycosyltransferase involved in cell wall biosynthesis
MNNNKPTLLFQAPVATRSGYGDHARDLLYSLYKLDKFNIKVISTRWGMTPMDALNYENEFHKWIVENIVPFQNEKPDVYVQVTVPNEFQPLGYYNIGITAAIETTVCAIDWIHGCNRMDMIIVPSEHAKTSLVGTIYNEADKQTNQIIRQHQIMKPVEVLFEGFDEAVFGTDSFVNVKEMDSVKEDFAFLFVGHWLKGNFGEDRKNVGMMIKAFAMAFKNEKKKPALVLKTSSATFSVRDREYIMKNIKQVLGDDYGKVPVYLLHGDLTQEEMNGLYAHPKVKAMLNFTKGEGFGRPLLEFSLTGKPVIVSNWSGHLDFLKSGAVLLDGELRPVDESAADQFLLREAQWFNVNLSKALPIIKDVYNNYDRYKVGAQQLAKYNKENFGLKNMTNIFDTVLSKYDVYNKIQPKMKQIQLPKLKKVELPKLKKIELPKLNKV